MAPLAGAYLPIRYPDSLPDSIRDGTQGVSQPASGNELAGIRVHYDFVRIAAVNVSTKA
jgi:hypothetical protein